MAIKWNDLQHKASAAKRARLQQEAHAELERIGFDKLRLARKQTQVAVAAKLKVAQGAVSRMEKQSDFLLSTLREYVSALGGQLELRAIFPDGDFVIESIAAKRSPKKRHTRSKAAA